MSRLTYGEPMMAGWVNLELRHRQLCAANTLVNLDNLSYSYIDTTIHDYRLVMRQT